MCARKKASAGAAAKVKKAAEAAAEVEQQKRAADDAALRAHMQKRLDAEERERTKDVNVEEEAAKRMREAERRSSSAEEPFLNSESASGRMIFSFLASTVPS